MSLIEKEPIMKFIEDGLNNKHYGYVGVEIITEVAYAPEIDAVPVVHYKDTNTTVLNVKSIEDWQDRIILDEGEESRSSAVYYTDSDDMVRVVRCKDCANTDGEVGLPEGMFYCNEWDSTTRGHWYCCRGERKEEGENK